MHLYPRPRWPLPLNSADLSDPKQFEEHTLRGALTPNVVRVIFEGIRDPEIRDPKFERTAFPVPPASHGTTVLRTADGARDALLALQQLLVDPNGAEHPMSSPEQLATLIRSDATTDSVTANEADGTPRVGAGFITIYAFAQLGNWVGLLTPFILTIALKVSQIASEAEKAAQLGAMLTVCAIVTAFAAPLWGALSDRTTIGLGRRKPWMIGGVLVAGIGLVIMALAPNILVLGAGWLVAQVAFNANQAVLNAILPDAVPESQRGKVSGLLGLTPAVAILAGSFLTQFTTADNVLMFLVPWFVTLAGLPLIMVVFKDKPADKANLRPYSMAEFLRSFWVNPIQNKDFSWAFISRFFLVLGQSFLTTYQVYFLIDHLSVGADQIATFVFFSSVVSTLITVVVSLGGGFLSDKVGRRKPFVLVAALIAAVGLLVIGSSTTFSQFLIGAAIMAFGSGLYYAVDLALVAAVITGKSESAKEMGVFGMSVVFAQSLAPAIAPIFLSIGAVATGNYFAVFIAAAVFAIIGAVTIAPVRSTR
jgi:MFS family permease